MGQYLSWEITDLKFSPGLAQEQIDAALEAVKAVAEKARRDGEAKIELVDRGAGLVIAIKHLHGWNADLADALREQAHLFEDSLPDVPALDQHLRRQIYLILWIAVPFRP